MQEQLKLDQLSGCPWTTLKTSPTSIFGVLLMSLRYFYRLSRKHRAELLTSPVLEVS